MEELKWLRKELTIWRSIAEMFYLAGQFDDPDSEMYYRAVDAYLDQHESEYNDDE
jgi:hypothetical protein